MIKFDIVCYTMRILILLFIECCTISERYRSRRWLVLKQEDNLLVEIYFLVYDGPAEKHGEWVRTKVGGVQASFVTVPLVIAFDQAFESVKRCGRVIAVGMPKGNMSVPITRWVTNGIQLIGSTLGSRQDLQEALNFAQSHQIQCKVEKRQLKDINQIFDEMLNYKITGRVVLDFVDK